MTLDEIYNEIKKSNSFVILTHENPDGDAIGSVCAMGLMLKNMGKTDVDIYLKEYPKIYEFVPGIEMITSELKDKKYDMAIALDCANLDRISKMYRTFFEQTDIRVQIDHHNKNTMFGDYNIVNPVSPSCTQILASSFDYLGIEITKDIASCIVTGIITDTYGFSSPETTTESFEFAAMALSKGVNVAKIYKNSLRKLSKTRFEIENLAKDRLEFLEDGKIAYTYMTKADEERIGAQTGDMDAIVEFGRNIEGVEVSIFIYEKENCYKASIRSNEYVDASSICLAFGGGGHVKAAGVNLQMTLEEAKETIINETKKYLK